MYHPQYVQSCLPLKSRLDSSLLNTPVLLIAISQHAPDQEGDNIDESGTLPRKVSPTIPAGCSSLAHRAIKAQGLTVRSPKNGCGSVSTALNGTRPTDQTSTNSPRRSGVTAIKHLYLSTSFPILGMVRSPTFLSQNLPTLDAFDCPGIHHDLRSNPHRNSPR